MLALGRARVILGLASLVLLAACSNGRGSLEQSGEPPTQPGQEGFTLGGTVSGLAGSGLVLRKDDGATLEVSGNGAFTFTGTLANGAAYNVAVVTQPSSPAQTCAVTNGSGTIAAANVTNVQVTCSAPEPGAFLVRGTVSGLAGSGLVLQNNGVDDVELSADGAFVFPTALRSGAPYNVTVRTHPTNPSQSCAIARGSGIMGTEDVTDVAVTCTTGTFTVGGTVSGLSGSGAPGSGVTLQNNGGDDLTIADNGSFVFRAPLASGSAYNVIVRAHPTNPVQTCAVENPAGTISDRSISNVRVKCATNVYTVGGTVTGLVGSGLVLEINGDRHTISGNGTYAFEKALRSGTPYFVRVRQQPSNPAQTCEVANANGVVSNSKVNNVDVTCTTRTFSIGGTVSGLAGSGLVLHNNGTDQLAIASNGSFTFQRELSSATAYHVSVRNEPSNPLQVCSIENGAGIVGSGNVSNVRVTCSTQTFAIRGSAEGVVGSGLVLLNGGGDPLPVPANGPFEFGRRVTSGTAYNVTVQTHPRDPAQTCTVHNASGVVTSSAVEDVRVVCTMNEFRVGGTVRGLVGSGLVLQNNGTDDHPVSSGTVFWFPTPVPDGAPYNVTIASQPTRPDQVCTVERASGIVAGQNVSDVEITCAAPEVYTVGGQVSGLTGSGLVLQNNGADDLAIAADGSFTFQTSHTNGTPYNVTVITQPSGQTCDVINGVGTIDGGDIESVQVTCGDNP